jgi:hypothetical protein
MTGQTPEPWPEGWPPDVLPAGHANGHAVPPQAGAPGGLRPAPVPARPVASALADESWVGRSSNTGGAEGSPARRAAWFVVIAVVLLGGMLLGARACAKALTDGDLALLRKEPIAAAPPSATEVHRSASLGGGNTLPYIERVYAVPNAAAALEYYTTTYGAPLNLTRDESTGATTLAGGRQAGKRRIGVRVDIRDVGAGPRLVEATPDTLKPAPPGTTSFVTVVLSATSDG